MNNHAALRELLERWDRLADHHGTRTFTGNDHRLFANELRAVLRTAASEGGEARGWLLESGGYCTFWQAEGSAKAEYQSLIQLHGYKDVTLTPLFTHPPEVARDAVDALRAEVTSLRLFANEIMNDWWEGDLDGGSRQDIAQRHGLIAGFEVTESCGELCNCAELGEWPTQCFRRTPLLTGNTESKAAISGAAGDENG